MSTADHLDHIDAACFSGTYLLHKANRDELKAYCESWLREIARKENFEDSE